MSLVGSVMAGSAWLLVVVGVGGDPEHRATFDARAQSLMSAAVAQHGVAADRVIYLAERPDEVEGADGRANADELIASIDRIAREGTADEPVLIVLMGHGSDQPPAGRFNLVGPDMAPEDFIEHLGRLSDRRVGLVNTTSSSGGFLSLAGPGRVVVTATANLREREEPKFGHYFVEAYSGAGADVDKDGRVSLAEAFEYAAREVERFYDEQGRLQVEHARLDGNGDGEAAAAPLTAAAEGELAHRLVLGAPVGTVAAEADPEARRLLAERAGLQTELEALRESRADYGEDEYLDLLEDLLVRIAELDAQLRALGAEQ